MLASARVGTLDDDRSKIWCEMRHLMRVRMSCYAFAGGRPLPSSPWTIAFRPPLAGGFLCRNFYTMLKHEFYDGFPVKILQVFT